MLSYQVSCACRTVSTSLLLVYGLYISTHVRHSILCTHVRHSICMYIRTYVTVYVRMYTRTSQYMYVHTYVTVYYVHTFVTVCVCTHVHHRMYILPSMSTVNRGSGNFLDAAAREKLLERQTMEAAKRSNDRMEEQIPVSSTKHSTVGLRL